MTTQNIYSSSYQRKITYDPAAAAGTPEMDVNGLVPITMALTTAYVQRTTGLLQQLLQATTEQQKSSIVARINVIRQELSYLTGVAFVPIQMAVAQTTDGDDDD